MSNLFTLRLLSGTANSFTVEVRFDPSHPVFAGHFPGMPVVPGVFLVEVLAAAVSQHLGKKVIVAEANNLKFIQMMDPGIHNVVMLNCLIARDEVDEYFRVDATFSAGDLLFAKMKGVLLAAHSL